MIGNIKDNEHIIAAFTEFPSGPGWANQVVWVILRDVNGKIRIEDLQPDEQSEILLKLGPISDEINRLIIGEIRKLQNNKTRLLCHLGS